MTDETPTTCPDCRCVKGTAATDRWNTSRYCHHCLAEHTRAGEHVPSHPRPGTHPDDAEEEARDPMFFHHCTRCDGTGTVLLTAWQPTTACFRCEGTGVAVSFGRSVQRLQRWTQTYQSNKETEARHQQRLR